MCKAINYSNQLLSVCEQIKVDYDELNAKLSKLDKMEQDVLHLIEFAKFNACEGYKLTKKLQEIRSERRKIKNELEPMRVMIDNIRPLKEKFRQTHEKVETTDQKSNTASYHPRVLKELFEGKDIRLS